MVLIAKLGPTLAISRILVFQAPLSMGFSRQDYWSGLPFPSPGNLPDPGIKPRSLALQADSLPSEPLGKPLGSPSHSNQRRKRNKRNPDWKRRSKTLTVWR